MTAALPVIDPPETDPPEVAETPPPPPPTPAETTAKLRDLLGDDWIPQAAPAVDWGDLGATIAAYCRRERVSYAVAADRMFAGGVAAAAATFAAWAAARPVPEFGGGGYVPPDHPDAPAAPLPR